MAHEKGNFSVRQANCLDDLLWITRVCEEEGFILREKETESYFLSNLTGFFFVGELDGERISCVASMKLDDSVVFLGFYIVRKPHRGKGYGLRTWKHAWDVYCSTPDCNVALGSVPHMEATYKKLGFRRVWCLVRYEISVSGAQASLSDSKLPDGIKLQRGSETSISQLSEYDTSISSVSRKSLLASWLYFADASCVAVNDKSEIVGCIVIRKMKPFDKHGYRVGPLYADNVSIAGCLLKTAIEHLSSTDNCGDNSLRLSFDIPVFPESVTYFERTLKASVVAGSDAVCMYTKSPPNIPFDKVYAIASLEMGF